MTTLFKSGDNMGITTDALTENDFLQKISSLFSEMITKKMYEDDWEFQLNYWLPIIVDICCKMRGYKSEVREKRVLSAGISDISEEVVSIDDRENVTFPEHGAKAAA